LQVAGWFQVAGFKLQVAGATIADLGQGVPGPQEPSNRHVCNKAAIIDRSPINKSQYLCLDLTQNIKSKSDMKALKFVLFIVIAGLFASTVESCGKKCESDPPQARVKNNGTSKASVQIKTSDGNTVNINNVDPGTASPYASYAAGNIEFTITVNNTVTVKAVPMSNCYNYDIAIDANNVITTTAFDRNK
jgi:hypothetical protein